MNPITVQIKSPSGETVRGNVRTWWYAGMTLFVEYSDESVESFPQGNVMKRLLP